MRDSDYIRFTIDLLSRAQRQAQYIAQKELLQSLVYDFANVLARNCVGFTPSRFVDECMREQLGSQYDPYSDIANLAVSTGWVGPEAGNRPNAAPPSPITPSVAAEQLQLYAGYGVAEQMVRQGGMVTGRLRRNPIPFAPIEEPEGEANGPEEGPATEQA